MQFKLAAVFLSICSLAAAACKPAQYVCVNTASGANRGLAQCNSDGSALVSLGDCGRGQHCQVTANAVACFAD
jgi:hypothetical protein